MVCIGTGFNEIDYAINDYETGLRILYVRYVLGSNGNSTYIKYNLTTENK